MGWRRRWGLAAALVLWGATAGVIVRSYGPRPWLFAQADPAAGTFLMTGFPRGSWTTVRYQQLWNGELAPTYGAVTATWASAGAGTDPAAMDDIFHHHVATQFAIPGVQAEEAVEWTAAPAKAGLGIPETRIESLRMSLWPLLVLFGLLPAWELVRRAGRAGMLRREGRCPTCAYDLRASGRNCPECGRDRDRIGRWEKLTDRVRVAGATFQSGMKKWGKGAMRIAPATGRCVALAAGGLWVLSWIQPTDVLWQSSKQCEVTLDAGRIGVRWAQRFYPALPNAWEAESAGYAMDGGAAAFSPLHELPAAFSAKPQIHVTCHVAGWNDLRPADTRESGAPWLRRWNGMPQRFDADRVQWRIGGLEHAVRECREDGALWDTDGHPVPLAERGAAGPTALRVWVWSGPLWMIVAAGMVWPVLAWMRRGKPQEDEAVAA